MPCLAWEKWCTTIVIFTLQLIYAIAFVKSIVDFTVEPLKSAFALENNWNTDSSGQILFATASNTDRYQLISKFGHKKRSIYFRGSEVFFNEYVSVTVHTFNPEVDERSKVIHFLCHASVTNDNTFLDKFYLPSSVCCIISINTTYSQEFTSCVLDLKLLPRDSLCHTSIKLPIVLWKSKNFPIVTISYTSFSLQEPPEKSNQHSYWGSVKKCHSAAKYSKLTFTVLPPATVVRSVPDAIRELGRSLMLQIPRRELRTSEEFVVPVRLKHGEDVTDFTLRFEIPANSYVEFVRVIWPGGIATTKYSGAQTPVYSFDSSSSSSVEDPQSVWDIFHRSVISQRRNVTEIVARFREDLVNNVQTLKNSPATEVYKLLFRVTRPPVGSAGRVAPRIFWSLVSLRRRDSSDHAVGGSPIVTRLNIESSELVHLVMVLKSSALVNLAALTGEPSVHPVWVYGLTYDAQVVDVTKRATCHTGDDAIIHFANDACDRLGFSGAELDGSPALPLVTKLDGRSATINLLVWFPKSPALRLAVGTSTQGIQNSGGSQKVDQVLMKRLDTETSGMGTKSEQSVCRKTGRIQLNDTNSMCYFQYLPVRVLARFILAGSVLYDKDVLGGNIDQFVDVTEYTAHRLRVDNLAGDHSNANSVSLDVSQRSPALSSLLHKSGDIRTLGTTEAHSKHANNVPYLRSTAKPGLASPAAWIVGNNPGKFRIWLEAVDRSRLDNAIPPGLAKQLREHLSDSDDSNQSHVVYASDEQPSLEIRVTDEVSVRAVGISAQLLTGFSMKLSHGIDLKLEREPISSEHGLNSLTEPLPLYSGLYALQYTLLGGSLVHSGTVNTSSTDSKTRLSGQTTSWRIVATTNASQESSNASNVEPMYLAIWIHLDDGSTLLWSHMAELYRDAHRSLPFQLTVDNLRPDLVHVSETNLNQHTRRRRHNMDFPVNCQRGTPSFAQHISRVSGSDFRQRQHIRVMDGVQFEENDKPCEEYDAQTWSGPVVRVLRHDTSFIGDLLQLSLLSPNGQLLLPKLTVPASLSPSRNPVHEYDSVQRHNLVPHQMETSTTVLDTQQPLKYNQTDPSSSDVIPKNYGQDDIKPRAQTMHEDKLLRMQVTNVEVPDPLFTVGDDHGLLALKDAPGFRRYQPRNRDQRKTAITPSISAPVPVLDDTSLSDQTREENTYAIIDNKHNGALVKPLERTSGSRPALEMSMYILLGLFALVGLVFAVNCGAVVARYRWERMGQLRELLRTERFTPSTPEDGCHSDSKPADNNCESNLFNVPNVTTTMREKLSLMKNWKVSLFSERRKQKSMLHKDTSWIWISRDEAKVNRQQEMVMTSTGTISGSNNNSPIFSSSVANCSAALHTEHCTAVRPHQFGGRQGNATAVLSVGEADMLLLHSPYHHAASPDEMYTSQVKRSTHCISDSFKTETLNRAHPSDNIWSIIGCGIHETEGAQTLGNHGRRHTTGAMTQRNYQGQECSIRIIANPISQQTNSAHTNRNRLHFKGCDIDTLATSTKFTCPVQGDLLIGPEVVQLHPGYSSASISRRRKKDSTHIWTSHTASRHPPPTHPAPPIPAGHLDVYHHYQKSDASMCRSWIHEKPIDQLLSNQVDYISDQMIKPREVQEHLCTEVHLPNSLKTTISPWNIRRAEKLSHKATTVNETDKASFGESSLGTSDYGSYLLNVCDSFESKIFEKKENSCAPHPPLRTTSRSLACRTLQSRRVDKLPAVCAQRPMSLPQYFHATNEVYALLEPNTVVTTVSGLNESHNDEVTKTISIHTDCLKSSPSEESLWWYHPTKQNRKRKSRAASFPYSIEDNAKLGSVTRFSGNSNDTKFNEVAESSDVMEYACPASCEGDDLTTCLKSPPFGFERFSHSSDRPDASNLTMASELAWDRDLLKLSHERLVAYFADMKESTA